MNALFLYKVCVVIKYCYFDYVYGFNNYSIN